MRDNVSREPLDWLIGPAAPLRHTRFRFNVCEQCAAKKACDLT